MGMQPPICRLCLTPHWHHQPHSFEWFAHDPPRSNSRSQSPRMPDTGHHRKSECPDMSSRSGHSPEQQYQSLGKSDTAPLNLPLQQVAQSRSVAQSPNLRTPDTETTKSSSHLHKRPGKSPELLPSRENQNPGKP